MQSELRTYFYLRLIPPAVCTTILLAARAGHWIQPVVFDTGHRVGLWLFLAAILLAVAVPVLLRTLFAHRVRLLRHTPPIDFYRLQRRLIGVTLAAAYAIPVVCLVELPLFYHAGVVLAALYAVYYQFPSARRIDFDRRIFRVMDEADARRM